MVVRRRKKSRKLRGRTRTMGWGRIGQHRKSGSRGGYGAAGLKKHKKTLLKALGIRYFGKHGFVRPPELTEAKIGINVGELEEIVDELISKGLAKVENDVIHVDLEKLGFNKLLGRGRVSKKFNIVVRYATSEAIRKIEEAGGKVLVLGQQKE